MSDDLQVRVAKALAHAEYSSPEVAESQWDQYMPDADAALAVMAAEHSRRIEVALGRVQEVWTRLRYATFIHTHKPLEGGLGYVLETVEPAELRTSLLAAMTDLQALLPAERGSEWAAKVERQA